MNREPDNRNSTGGGPEGGSQPASVLLLGATFDSGNMGVGALAASAVRVLHQRYPQAQIAILDYAREARPRSVSANGALVPVGFVNLRFSWKLFLPNNVALLLALAWLCRILPSKARAWVVKRNSWLQAIDRADVAFAVSGGDSFSDIYGMGRFLYVTLPQFLVTSMGKTLVLLPQTIGPFQSGRARRLASDLMRKAVRVYSRDRPGVDLVRQLAGRSEEGGRVRFCYDLAFVLEPLQPASLRMVGPSFEQHGACDIVGLNVSGLLMMGGYDGRNMFELKVDYRDLINALVRRFCEDPGTAVVLVPHVFSRDAESDQVACRAIYDQFSAQYPGKISYIESVHDQHEIKYLIGRCSFLVGARMHACIAALSQAIPAIGVAYSRKFAGVLESVGAGDLVVDPRSSTLEQILKVVADRFADRKRISATLATEMPRVKQHVLGMLDDLRQ